MLINIPLITPPLGRSQLKRQVVSTTNGDTLTMFVNEKQIKIISWN